MWITAGTINGSSNGTLDAGGANGFISNSAARRGGLRSVSYPGGGGRIAVYCHQHTFVNATGAPQNDPLAWPIGFKATGGYVANDTTGFSGTRSVAGTVWVQCGPGRAGMAPNGPGLLVYDNFITTAGTAAYQTTGSSATLWVVDTLQTLAVGVSAAYEGFNRRWFDANETVFGGPHVGNYNATLGGTAAVDVLESGARTLLADAAIGEMVAVGGIYVKQCYTNCGSLRLYAPPSAQLPLAPTGTTTANATVFAMAAPVTGSGIAGMAARLNVAGGAVLDYSGTGGLTPAVLALLASPFGGRRASFLASASASTVTSGDMAEYFPGKSLWMSATSFAASLRWSSWQVATQPLAAWLSACLSGSGSAHGTSLGAGVLLTGVQLTPETNTMIALPPTLCMDAALIVHTSLATLRTPLPDVQCAGFPAATAGQLNMTWLNASSRFQPYGPSFSLGPGQPYVAFNGAVAPGAPPLRAAASNCTPIAAGLGTQASGWLQLTPAPLTRYFADLVAASDDPTAPPSNTGFQFLPFATPINVVAASVCVGKGRVIVLPHSTNINVSTSFQLLGGSTANAHGAFSLVADGTVRLAANSTVRRAPGASVMLTPSSSCRAGSGTATKYLGSSHAGCDSASTALAQVRAAGLPTATAYLACSRRAYGNAITPTSPGCDAPTIPGLAGIAVSLVSRFGGSGMVLDGVIDASAKPVPQQGLNVSIGGASGGSIRAVTPLMASAAGTLLANGGTGGEATGTPPLQHGAGGSGGRVSVICDALADQRPLFPSGSLTISAVGGGDGGGDGSGATPGQGAGGTIYINCQAPDSLLADTLFVHANGSANPAKVGATLLGPDLPPALEGLHLLPGAVAAFVHNNTAPQLLSVRRLVGGQSTNASDPIVTITAPRPIAGQTAQLGAWNIGVGVVDSATINVQQGSRLSLGMRNDGWVFSVPVGYTPVDADVGVDMSGSHGIIASLRRTRVGVDTGGELFFPHLVRLVGGSFVNASGSSFVRLPALGGAGVLLDDGFPVLGSLFRAQQAFVGAASSMYGCPASGAIDFFPMGEVVTACFSGTTESWEAVRRAVTLAKPWDCWPDAPVSTYPRDRIHWLHAVCSTPASNALTVASDVACSPRATFYVPASTTDERTSAEVGTCNGDLIVCGVSIITAALAFAHCIAHPVALIRARCSPAACSCCASPTAWRVPASKTCSLDPVRRSW